MTMKLHPLMRDKTEDELVMFGYRVHDERKRMRMSQAELAKAVGIARSSLSMIENGKRKLDQFELIRLAQKLRVSVEELFGI